MLLCKECTEFKEKFASILSGWNDAKPPLFSGAFNGADSLYIIYLFQNDLTTIPEGTFADLVSLQELNLYDNPVHTLGIGNYIIYI